jgi:hypothetical protein
MASPHAAGVAALTVSQIGTRGRDGDIKSSPSTVQSRLKKTMVDIGRRGDDKCFGHGRIDARRAVTGNTDRLTDRSAPNCPEYNE